MADASSKGRPDTSNGPMTNGSTDRWFLQIKEGIYGPMNAQKVFNKLIEGEIYVTTRVSNDRRTWSAICNVPLFEQLVEERIRAYSGQSEMYIQAQTSSDFEQVESLSQIKVVKHLTSGINEQLDTAKQLEELTANIQKLNSVLKEIQMKRKTIVQEKENEKSETAHPDDENIFIPLKRKKIPMLAELFSRDNKFFKPFAVLMTVGLLITGGVEYYLYQDNQKIEADKKAKLKQALQESAAGEYAKAMASFRESGGTSGVSPMHLLTLAEAHIKGRDTATAQRLINDLLTTHLSSAEGSRAHELNAILAAAAGQPKKVESELEASVNREARYSNLHNLGVIKFKNGKFDDAEPFLLRALQMASTTQGADRESTILSLFEVSLAQEKALETERASKGIGTFADKPPQTHSKLEQFKGVLLETLKTDVQHLDEFRIALTMTYFSLGDRAQFQTTAIELIDSPKTKLKPRDQFDLFTDLASWNNLYKHCAAIYDKERTNDFVAAFYAACLTRSHGYEQALPFAQYAMSMRHDDPVYAGLVASILFEIGKTEEAKALLSGDSGRFFGSKLATKLRDDIDKGRIPASTTAPKH